MYVIKCSNCLLCYQSYLVLPFTPFLFNFLFLLQTSGIISLR